MSQYLPSTRSTLVQSFFRCHLSKGLPWRPTHLFRRENDKISWTFREVQQLIFLEKFYEFTKVLSPDNFIKMIWIALRVESKVPATWLEVARKDSSWRAGEILVRASSKWRCLVRRWKQTWLVDVFLLESMNFDFHVSLPEGRCSKRPDLSWFIPKYVGRQRRDILPGGFNTCIHHTWFWFYLYSFLFNPNLTVAYWHE